jgi:hypothetical protein
MVVANRNVMTSFHLTMEVKDALREEAAKNRVSMSVQLFLITKHYLHHLGYDVEPKIRSKENEPELPFTINQEAEQHRIRVDNPDFAVMPKAPEE